MLQTFATSNAYSWSAGSHLATRPANNFGTTVTPGAINTKGSWTSLMASAARDVFGILINVNTNGASTQARDSLMDIGVDPSGGTSYSVLIPNLLISCATPRNVGNGGIWYWFPIWIKAGSRIGARTQVNNATPGSPRVNILVFGSPHDRRSIWCGTRVEAVGITEASSAGTAVTSGTTSEGSWTELGTLARDARYWQMGFGVNNGVMTGVSYHADLGIGDASNKAVVIENQLVTTTTAETMTNNAAAAASYAGKYAPAGTNVYGRIQCSGTAIAGLSLAAYAVG